MFAADAGKLWVLNGVQRTRRGIERKVEWLSAGENACASRQPEILGGGVKGSGEEGWVDRHVTRHTRARAWWADAV